MSWQDAGVVAAALAAFLAITFVLSRRRNFAGTASVLLFVYGVLATFLATVAVLTLHVHWAAVPALGSDGGGAFGVHVHSLYATLTEGPSLAVVVGAVAVAASAFAVGFSLNQLVFRRLRGRAAGALNAEETARAQPFAGPGAEVLVTKDEVPRAYCFAMLVRSGGLWPWKARELLAFTDSLTRAMDSEMLQAVVAHESAHVRARDSRHLPVVRAVGALFFFDPLFRRVARRLEVEREFRADRTAAEETRKPLALARALLTALELAGEAGRARARAPRQRGLGCGLLSLSEPELAVARIERLIEMDTRLGDA